VHTGMRVAGWGSALPDEIVSNEMLSAVLDTSDSWIRERTGIVQRRWGGTTAGLAVAAARQALDRAGLEPREVDGVLLATTTPDRQIPATSAAVQHELGVRGAACDINAACSGFIYSLVVASGMLRGGMNAIVVVGSETLSRFTDRTDRTTAVLMGDGAGAIVVTRSELDCLIGFDLGCDGSSRDLLYAEIGGTIVMRGQEVFKRAVTACVRSSREALHRAGITVADVDLFVPHQANLRIIEAAVQRLGIPSDRTAVTIATTGNTSAASIPIAISDAAAQGRLNQGDIVLMTAFGAGMTWASAVVVWG
jgi:3-oxoacyl-[acyl-carrier-protein] synthase III